jgi:pantetheine-phosphate adenylyltransferase
LGCRADLQVQPGELGLKARTNENRCRGVSRTSVEVADLGRLRGRPDRLRDAVRILSPSVRGTHRARRVLPERARIGIEALSRGAAHVTFIENDPRAIKLIEANAALRSRARQPARRSHAIIRAGFADARRADGNSISLCSTRRPDTAVTDAIGAVHPLVKAGPASSSSTLQRVAAPAEALGAPPLRTAPEPAIAPSRFMNADTLAIYPGTFDPLTNGTLTSFSVAPACSPESSWDPLERRGIPLFTISERVEIAREVFGPYTNVEVDTFDGLLVDYARRKRAGVIVRGLRAISDFEYEMQMALMNRHLNPEVETVFMMPAEPYTYVSSRLVKEVVALGGSVTALVPSTVEDRLRKKKLGRELLGA